MEMGRRSTRGFDNTSLRRIPNSLHCLGTVFFPLPPRSKGWKYPHSLQDYRYAPGDSTLDAYLEYSTWGYGIACADDLIVIDIDDKSYLDDVTSRLPITLHQYTGSGDGVHIFYNCPDRTQGASLYDSNENVHVGDIKAHERSYVVGPGSTHPSGNKYGPVYGDEIAEIGVDKVNELVDDYTREGPSISGSTTPEGAELETAHDLYSITASDVRPDITPGSRCSNPFHGSSTGTNFMRNDDGETFTCWRCDVGSGPGCGLNGTQYLACKGVEARSVVSDEHCAYVRRRWSKDHRLHYYAWKQAINMDLVNSSDPPYKVVTGHGLAEGIINDKDNMDYILYNNLKNSLLYSLYWL